MKEYFSTREILSRATKAELTSLFNEAASREVLYRTMREYGLSNKWMHFWSQEQLAEYLANELWTMKATKPLRRKVSLIRSLIRRLRKALRRKSDGLVLSITELSFFGLAILMIEL